MSQTLIMKTHLNQTKFTEDLGMKKYKRPNTITDSRKQGGFITEEHK